MKVIPSYHFFMFLCITIQVVVFDNNDIMCAKDKVWMSDSVAACRLKTGCKPN